MANQTINVALEIKSNTKAETEDAKKFRKELEKAREVASSMGGTSGSRKVSSIIGSAAMAAADNAMPDGLRRGTAGGGGRGDSRDFSRQAQGLGGLVHVYATFAANMFAVSAAFNALSKAADTTNMVEGLNQLGAASGRNLGTMAKNVVAITDNAVSMRQAMEATAQASAAGLSGDQLKRMSEVAKKASQALGRDIPDSLNRLSRGITKIEPELLDELGIMVKVDKAAAEYARTLGKTTTSLTDFERRQAFANAVLKQGEDKFGKINIDANPYAKLQASFQNLAQSGLEVLNKVLGPLVSALSSSPIALSTVVAGIGATLLTVAIPAISQWKKQMKQAADESNTAAKEKLRLIDEEKKKRREALAAQEKARDTDLQMLEDSIMGKLSTKGGKSGWRKEVKSIVADIQKTQSSEITDAQINALDKYIKRDATGNALKGKSQLYEELKLKILAARDAAVKLQEVEERHLRPQGTLSTGWLNERLADKAAKKARNQNLISEAVNRADLAGVREGFKKLNQTMAEGEDRVTGFAAGLLRVRAGTAMVVQYAGKLLNAFSNWGIVVAAVGIAIETLDYWLSTSAKELENYTSSLETANEAQKGLASTLNYISRDTLKSENIQAYANSINELSNSSKQLVKDFLALQGASSWWDNSTDFVKQLWGGSSSQKLAATLSGNFTQLLSSITSDSSSRELKDQITKIFKDISPDDLSGNTEKIKKNLSKALKTTIDSEDIKTVEKLVGLQEEFNKKLNNSASELTSFNSSMETAHKSLQDLVNTFTPTDAMSKFGIAQIDVANKLSNALKDPVTRLTALKESMEDLSKRQVFANAIEDLKPLQDEVKKMYSVVSFLDRAILERSTEVEKKKREAGPISSEFDTGGGKFTAANEADGELEFLREKRDAAVKKSNEVTTALAVKLFQSGAEKLIRELNQSFELGAIKVAKARAEGGSGAEQSRKMYELTIKEINAQERLITESMNLAFQLEKNTDAVLLKSAREDPSKKGLVDRLENKSKVVAALEDPKLRDKTRDALLNKKGNVDISDDTGRKLFTVNDEARVDTQTLVIRTLGTQRELYNKKVEKGVALLQEEKNQIDIAFKLTKDLLALDSEKARSREEELKTLAGLASINSDVLNDAIRSTTIERQRQDILAKNLDFEQQIALNIRAGNTAEVARLRAQQSQTIELQKQKDRVELVRIEAENQRKINKFIEDRIVLAESLTQFNNRILSDTADIRSRAADTLVQYGKMSEATALRISNQEELSKLERDSATENDSILREYRTKLAAINERKLEASNLDGKTVEQVYKAVEVYESLNKEQEELTDNVNKQLKQQDELNKKRRESLVIQQTIKQEMANTEATMRNFERGQGTGREYLQALQDSFSNKLSLAIASSKSAGDALTSGLISATDKSIDAFTEMVQKMRYEGFDIKALATQIRNYFSDAFREAAAQGLKNAWKEAFKSFLPQTDMDKQLGILAQIEVNTRQTSERYPDIDYSKDIKKGAEKVEDAGGYFSKGVNEFGLGIKALITGQGNFLQYFSSAATQMLLSLTSIFSTSAATSAASGGGGFLSTLFSVVTGALGGGDTGSIDYSKGDWSRSPIPKAFGGIFGGSPSLSAYSNSIVSSPTRFAFAHGAGLMREAGPEAIMPLRRHPSGYLGVRAETAAPVININVTNEAGREVQATAQATPNDRGGVDVEVLVTRAITGDLARNGPISKNIANTFGVRRQVNG